MEYISTATAGFGYLAERVPGKGRAPTPMGDHPHQAYALEALQTP
jgi:hypothetical protein